MKCVLKHFVCPSHPHLPYLTPPPPPFRCLCTALGARMPQVLHIIKLKPGIKLWPLAALMCRTANSSAGQWCIDCGCCLLLAACCLVVPCGASWCLAATRRWVAYRNFYWQLVPFAPACHRPHWMPTRAFAPFSPLRTFRIYHFYKPLSLSGCHIAVTTGYRPDLLVKLSAIQREPQNYSGYPRIYLNVAL